MTEPGAPKGQLYDLTPIDGGVNDSMLQTQRVVQKVLAEQEARREKKEKEERDAAHKRRMFWGKVIGGAVTAVLGGGGITLSLKSDDTPPIMPSDLKQDVKKALDKGEENSKQIRALGKVTVEGMDYLGKKIDKAHPEVRVVEKPDSLKNAEKAVSDQETNNRVDDALGIVKSVTTGGETDG